MPSNSKYGFGKSAQRRFIDLQLPSIDEETGEHHVILVRRPDPMIMVDEGLLDDFDTLTGLVGMKIQNIEGKDASAREAAETEQLKQFAANVGAVQDGVKLMDRMIVAVVVEPNVRRPLAIDCDADGTPKLDARGRVVYLKNDRGEEIPILDSERDDDIVYTDEIPFDNKVFIMNYAVGGTRDLESFRNGLDSVVERMADGEGVPLPSLSPPLAG